MAIGGFLEREGHADCRAAGAGEGAGAGEFGILAIAALTYNLLSSVNELGMADALTYLQDQIEEATRTALSLVLAAGLVLMAADLGARARNRILFS